jgi:predicted phage replisome organizer
LIFETRKDRDSIELLWFKLLTLAAEVNDGGKIYITESIPHTLETLASVLLRPTQMVKTALDLFEQYEMIYRAKGMIYIANWDKYQNSDKLEKIREQTRERVEKHRKKTQCNDSCNAECNADCNVTVTLPVTLRNATDIDIDKEKDKEYIDIDEPTKRKRFVKPTLEELEAYKSEKNLNIDCVTFFDYYESNGWQVGKNHMKDWKAAMRRWSRENDKKPTPKPTSQPNRIHNFDERRDDLSKYMVRKEIL